MKTTSPQQSMRLAQRSIILSLCMIPLTACTPQLNINKFKTVVGKEFTEKTKIAIQNITCPKNVEIKVGKVFNCEIEAEDGKVITLEVTQTNDSGKVSWKAKVSTSRLEHTVEQEFVKQIGIAVRAVTCPEAVEIVAGRTFDCEIVSEDGKVITLQVTQKDSQGNVTWTPPQNLIPLKAIETSIQRSFQQLDSEVVADCGGKYRIGFQGDQFTCEARDSQDKIRTIEVTVNDNAGNVDWKALQP